MSEDKKTKEPAPKTGWRNVLHTGRHFLVVGHPAAGKTTMLAVGLRRLCHLGVYAKIESAQKASREFASTPKGAYPNYRCRVPWRLAKARTMHKKFWTAAFGGLPSDVWHDCDGFSFSGHGENPTATEPLLEAAAKVFRLLYVAPASVVLTERGQLNRTWVDELRRFGQAARPGTALKKLWGMRQRKLAIIISKAEAGNSPELSTDSLRAILPLLRQEPDLAELYDAAFLVRATSEEMRAEASKDEAWDKRIRDWTESGAFLKKLGAVGFGDGKRKLSATTVAEEVATFESAVPLAWAAGFLDEKELAAYADSFVRLRGGRS
jgi:hypothetical protein